MIKKQSFALIVFVLCSKVFTFASSADTLFEKIPASQTGIDFKNTPPFSSKYNIINYSYYYNGGGVAVGDINNDGLMDIYFTSNTKAGNKLYLNKGNFVFEDITEQAGVAGTADWSSGVTMADVNGDGLIDIYVSVISGILDLEGHNQLYINKGDNTFTDAAEPLRVNVYGATSQSAFFDYDHDGDLDCFVLSQSIVPNDRIPNAKKRNEVDSIFKSRLLRNEMSNGNFYFTDVSTEVGIYQSDLGYGLGIAVGDLNNDGWEDVYIGNDFYENDYYYVNNGDGTFTEKGEQVFGHYSMNSMGSDIADYNNDGQLDIITVDMLSREEERLKKEAVDESPFIYEYKFPSNGYHDQYVKNCLHTNNGNGQSFSETSFLNGVSATGWSWAPLFADFDNDGNKDLVVTSGLEKNFIDMDFLRFVQNNISSEIEEEQHAENLKVIDMMSDGSSHPHVFQGDGNLLFKDMSKAWGTENLKGSTNGSAYVDLDNDGDLDLVMNSYNDTAIVLKNTTHDKNFAVFQLIGAKGNKNAIGAKVYLYANDKVQYQQVMATRGFQSSVDPRVYFGLDQVKNIDSVVVVWTTQKKITLKNLMANNLYMIKEDNEGQAFVQSDYFKTNNTFEDISDNIKCDWKHKENIARDFYLQFLIPQAKSKRGPKVAVADVNGDGLDDFYVCGAAKQPGTLMIQNSEGNFEKSNEVLFRADSVMEDVDALYFDANNDGKPDLYVVSGGNEFKEGSPKLGDRIYINKGKGRFVKTTDELPQILMDKSCVASADIDNDGDADLFVGGFLDSRSYGTPQSSYMLINNGKGHFDSITTPFQNLGMVTAASFADVNNDDQPELIVVGEWMEVTIFINDKGSFIKTSIPNSSGLWQSICMQDVNGDGNMDMLLGNWGYNTKFWDGKTPPLRLYVGDFDNNGNVDQLLSYVYKGEEYSFLGKDKIEHSLPVLKKKYLLFNNFAGVPFQEAFGDLVKGVKPLTVERLGSAVAYGDGKGNFSIEDLPMNMQLAPVNAIQTSNTANEYLLGGNNFEATPYEGKYDAQPLTHLQFKDSTISKIYESNFSAIKGQVRDLQWIVTPQGKVLLVARNNEPLLFYKPINQ